MTPIFYQISVSILWRRYRYLSFYSNIGIHSVEKIKISFILLKYQYPYCGEDITSFPFIKYRYPYCGEDIDLFHFTQISVSILWRRYNFLPFHQISVSILWRRYRSLSFYSNIGIHTVKKI